MNLTLVLTHACNLRCSYCYAGTARHDGMSRQTLDAALDFGIARWEPTEKFQLGFFGGEPLLAWDALQYGYRKTADRLGSQGFLRTVTTNGTLLTRPQAAFLQQENIYTGLSLDGNQAMHDMLRRQADGQGSFEATLRGLRLLQQAGCRYEVITVVSPRNVAQVADGVRFLCEEMGVERLSLNPDFYDEWNEEDAACFDAQYAEVADFIIERYRASRPVAIKVFDGKIITRLKQGYACGDRCGFGGRELAVAPSGNLYPCERVVGEDAGGELCLGNVFDGFDEPRHQAVLAARGNRDPECADCSLGPRCMNWCGCINHGTTGRIDSTGGFVCHHEKTLVREADRLATLLFNEGNPAFIRRFYERQPTPHDG